MTVRTPRISVVYADPTQGLPTGELVRPVGVHLRGIALADEAVPVERCPA